ncbi:MAG: tetratricopeptide (TPR) repeat protein [Candidatus Endobugula sp.]
MIIYSRASRLPKGKRNKTAYQRTVRQITTDEKAIAQAQKKSWASALKLAKAAIKQQSKEARFYITKNRRLNTIKKSGDAITAYSEAIHLEPNYFAGFFYRGLTQQVLNNTNAAEKDLINSNSFLKTGVANCHPGDIALLKNQRASAINYYRLTVKSGGDAGKVAKEKLRKL